MKKDNKILAKLLPSLKEFGRKFIVSLKKNPGISPLVFLFIAFLAYSLNLTGISDATAIIQGKNMGLCEFIAMLLSILSMICLLNAFPKRKKPNYPMIVLFLVLVVIIIIADTTYITRINEAFVKFGTKIKQKQYDTFLLARNTTLTHIILMSVTALVTIFQPVYVKLLKKINTSVELEENNVESIELSDEE